MSRDQKCKQTVRKLLLFRLRGGIRQRLRELRSIRGILYVALILCFVLFIWHSFSIAQLMDPATASALTHQYLPAGLLLGCLVSALISSGPALYFSETEQNLLFSAPVPRHQLALYKITSYASSAALSSLVLAALLPPVLGSSILTFFSTLLTLMFIQLLSATINLSLVYCKKEHQLYIIVKRIAVFLLGSIVAWFAISFVVNPGPVSSHLSTFVNLALVRSLLMPFDAIADLHFAESPGRFALLAATASVLLTVLIRTIVWLDKNLVEESLSQSLAAQQNWQRILSTGIIWKHNVTIQKSRKVPARLGGFGPVAWQQWQRAVRTSPTTLGTLALLALVGGPLFTGGLFNISATTGVAMVYFLAVFLLPRFIVFDFRTSLDTMQYLKTLPVPSILICIGQVAVPTVVTTGIELIMLLTSTPFVKFSSGVLALAFPMILMFNFLLYLIENTFFLLFPTRMVPVGRVDFDFLGRTLGEFLVKSVLLAAVFSLAIAAAFQVGGDSSLQNTLFTLTLLTVPLLFSFLMVYILSRAYDRYDVTFQID